MAGHFHDAAFRGKSAFQDDEAAGGLKRRVEFANDLLIGRFFCGCSFFPERAASDGDGLAKEDFRVQQPLGDKSSPTSGVKIGGDKAPAGLQISENRHAAADAIKIVDGERDFRFTGDG